MHKYGATFIFRTVINIDSVSTETFQILRSYDYTVLMYDEEGMEVYEPEQARRMYAKPENLVVSIVDDNENSRINLILGSNSKVRRLQGLIDAIKACGSKYNMLCSVKKRQHKLEPKMFATKASVSEGRNSYMTDLTEGLYGTSRSSYLNLENARMIVRHSGKIDENIVGARSRMIESILIENDVGERFLMPTNQLAPARAMTQHVNQGGSFADELGAQFQRMATSYADLGACSHFVGTNAALLPEGAVGVRGKCMESRKGLRKTFGRIARESTYADECNIVKESIGKDSLVEAAVLENLRGLLTLEGKCLDESVIQTVAMYIGETADDRMIEEDSADAEVEVMGQMIKKHVLTAFMKQGKLDLRRPPRLDHVPDFANKTSEIIFKLSEIAEVTADDQMSNLLGAVAERLPIERDVEKRRALLNLAAQALKSAKVGIKESNLGPQGSKAILEFQEWYKQFDPVLILSEGDNPFAKDDEDEEETLDEGENPFADDEEEDDSLEEGENPFAKKDGDDEDEDESLEEGENPFAKDAEEDEEGDDEALEEGEDEDCDPLAKNVGDDDDLKESDFDEEDEEIMEDRELRREDIILPKDKGLDLAREVSFHGEAKDKEELDESIQHILALARRIR